PKNEILDFATGSEYKVVFPNKKLNYLVGLFLGFVLPMLFLWLYHNFNKRIRSIDDIKQLTNYPVIATIFNDTNPGIFIKEQNSAIKESLRTLKANLQFIINEEQSNIIMITSTIPGEGKSYISTHLASIYTSFGKSVCLADFDLRKGKLSRNFNVFSEEGLSTFLSDRSSLEDIICKSEYGFDILPSGAMPPNPGVLISSSNCDKLFKLLKEKYDIVIIDTPPVGVVSDTLFLNTKVEQILYVSRFNESPTPLLNHVLSELEMKKIDNLAIILNAVPNKKHTYGYSYGYGYGYGYYSKDKNRFFKFLNKG
ncbi:MAG: polysaccharide biosynthesis tyrosine autokinase, partial [Bacteroidales bacterium]|nr:polysaccharide biosynthesis tyrosine autokinase [Bacteroidales bacterium]